MLSYELNRDYVRAALGDLQAYLLSRELFWTLPGGPALHAQPFLQLTLGNLLLALDALRAASDAAGGEHRAEVERLQTEWEAARTRWAVHVERKAQHELASRLRQWRITAQEALEAGSAEEMADSVRPRLVAARLLDLIVDPIAAHALRTQLDQTDERLAALLEPGPFVLDPSLQASYSQAAYPFLYRRPRAPG